MSNVLAENKRQQVLALGRLGWSLRRIERATGVRRETASGYLKATGVVVRGRGRPGARPANPAISSEVSTDSSPAPAADTGTGDAAPRGVHVRHLRTLFGQELDAETYAICTADLLLNGEGEAAANIVGGPEHSTLATDAFPSREFDFMLSNPPHGKIWKTTLQRMGDGCFASPGPMARTRDPTR